MTEVQEHLFSLLQEFDDICREHAIPYYLDGGTAIGAIRHRGFLPWDDDIDILLTRDSYQKLKQVIEDNPRPDRILVDQLNNEKYTMVYARYCDLTSTCILRTSMMDQFKSGIFLDVLILDPVPDTPEAVREYFDILHGYAEYLNPFYYDTIIGDNEWYVKFCDLGKREGRQAVYDYVKKRIFSYPDEDGMTYVDRFDDAQYIYSRKTMGTPRYVLFEGMMLPVASEPEDFLRSHYGDHWDIIPDNTNVQTHNVVINVDIPYEQFRDSYLYLINKDAEIQNYYKLHDMRIQRHQMTAQIDIKNYTTASQLYATMLSVKEEKAERSMLEMLRERDYAGVRAFLGNYYAMQLHRWYMRYQVFVPVKDDALYCALYVLLTEGDYAAADKILNLRKATGETLSPRLELLDGWIADIRRIIRRLEKRDAEAALILAEQGMENVPDVPDFVEGAIRARAMLLREESEAAALLEMIRSQSETVLKRDRVCGVENMLVFRYGAEEEKKQAETTLRFLMEKSSNGVLRLEIKDFFDSLETEGDAVK